MIADLATSDQNSNVHNVEVKGCGGNQSDRWRNKFWLMLNTNHRSCASNNPLPFSLGAPYLHEHVINASHAVRSTNVLLLVPFIEQRAAVRLLLLCRHILPRFHNGCHNLRVERLAAGKWLTGPPVSQQSLTSRWGLCPDVLNMENFHWQSTTQNCIILSSADSLEFFMKSN